MELSVVGFVDLVKNFKKIALFVEFMIAFFKGQEQTRLWLQDHLNCVFFQMKSSKPLNIGFPLYKICYLKQWVKNYSMLGKIKQCQIKNQLKNLPKKKNIPCNDPALTKCHAETVLVRDRCEMARPTRINANLPSRHPRLEKTIFNF